VVSGVKQGGGEGMGTNMKLFSVPELHSIFKVLIIFGTSFASAVALENADLRDKVAQSEVAVPAPIIALDYKRIHLPSGDCFPIPEDLESKIPGLEFLAESVTKDGHTFQWRKSSNGNAIYWDRERIENNMYRLAVYIEKIGQSFQFNATSMAAVLTPIELEGGIHQDYLSLERAPEGWSPGLSFIVLNEDAHEGLHIGFWSLLIDGVWTPNKELRFVNKGAAICRRLRGSN
jgi:hypothetical protein